MKKLMFVHPNKGKPFVSTNELYYGFGYKKHEQLKRVIKTHENEFLERGILDFAESIIKGRGQPEKSYLLNERHFVLLCLLVKNTPNSVKIKSAIESEFSKLRKLQHEPGRQTAVKFKRDTMKLMMDFKKVMMEHHGIKISTAEYIKENLFCNRALTGKWDSTDETILDAYDVKLLGEIRIYNMFLIATLGLKQTPRKEPMRLFVDQYRLKNPRKQLEQA